MSQAFLKLPRVGGLRQLIPVPCSHKPALSSLRCIKLNSFQSDRDLPFPDLPSVDKDREEESELPLPPDVTPRPEEPDNPMPELPPNHPKEVNLY
jgi:hypothetical protein